MIDPEKAASQFVANVQQTSLPIESSDAYNFAKAMISFNPPEGWLGKVARAATYISRDKFFQDLDTLAERSKEFIGSNPYAAFISKPEKSDYWVYKLLQERGLPKAEIIYNDRLANIDNNRVINGLVDKKKVAYEGHDTRFKGVLLDVIPRPIVESIPDNYRVCSFDDFSITGNAFNDMLSRAEYLWLGKQHAFYLYGTKDASKALRSEEWNITAHQTGDNIPTLNSLTNREDKLFLRRVSKTVGAEIPIDGISVLFWTWYKVPDNIPEIFTGKGLPALIRKEMFQPPYKPTQAK